MAFKEPLLLQDCIQNFALLLNLHYSDLALSAHSEGGSTIYRRYDPKLIVLKNCYKLSNSVVVGVGASDKLGWVMDGIM